MRIITEPKELIGRYVARKIGAGSWKDFAAVGLLNDDDELVAGAVFNGYSPPNVLMHIAAERLTPAFVAAFIQYPFEQMKAGRITGLIDASNAKSRRFAEHLGAKLEGVMRQASPKGDVCVYGLLAKDAQRWLTQRYKQRLFERV